jgi:hypothetical protein
MPIRCCVLLVALALVGCEDPDALLIVSGTFVTSHGDVGPIHSTSLLRSNGNACSLSAPAVITTVPDGGFYFFEMLEATTHAQEGLQHDCFSVVAPSETGAESDVSFVMNGSDVSLPPTLEWTDPVEAAIDDGGIHVTPSSLPATPGVQPAVDGGFDEQLYQAELRLGADLIWAEPTDGGVTTFDPAVLEDFTPVAAGAQAIGTGMAGPFNLFVAAHQFVEESRTPGTSVANDHPRTPVSRGARCSTSLGPLDPCPFTDGVLDRIAFDSGVSLMPTPLPESIVITLGAPASIQTILIRDVSLSFESGPTAKGGMMVSAVPESGSQPATLLVEGSSDSGSTWQSLGTAVITSADLKHSLYRPGRFLEIPVAAPVPSINAVRLSATVDDPQQGPSSAQFRYLSEVSLFE